MADGHVRRAGPRLLEHIQLTQRRVARNGVRTRPRAQIRVVREDRKPGTGLRLGHGLEHLPLVGRHHAALLPDLAERAVLLADSFGREGRRQLVRGLRGERRGERPLHVIAAAGDDGQTGVGGDAAKGVEVAAHVGVSAIHQTATPSARAARASAIINATSSVKCSDAPSGNRIETCSWNRTEPERVAGFRSPVRRADDAGWLGESGVDPQGRSRRGQPQCDERLTPGGRN